MEHVRDIILVDDHVIIRNGLKELIEKLGPYRVSREYDNGREFTESFPLQPVPDLVIMDIAMPEMNGDEVMEVMNQLGMEVPVLILTLNQDENLIIRLFRQGVRGYLRKDCTAVMMKKALTDIFTNDYYHNELLALALRTQDASKQKTVQELAFDALTAREKEFLKLVCDEQEYTYQQIAGMMGVQHRTVDGYRQAIFEKLDIRSKTGLVLFMIRHKLLEKL
jgi:two-component system invasion response regulator UvrY